jgi:DNA processing protein
MPRLALAEPDDDAFTGQPKEPEGLDHARDAVVAALGPSPVSVDEIVRSLGLPADTVRSILLELELTGRLERQPGNFVTLISD